MSTVMLLLLLSLTVSSLALPHDSSQELINSHLKALQESRRTVQLLREILDDMDSNMEVVQKRSCIIGGGVNRACDYQDVLNSGNDLRHLLSEDAPGKRSIRSAL
ncbi:uncharacterized protein [Anabrus simplex]|uniref:uncharacterized protein n=1 Tax=Anabrus simplex TaxID=316456 RepID=UPI0034DCDCC9